jgi:hypothetical protein
VLQSLYSIFLLVLFVKIRKIISNQRHQRSHLPFAEGNPQKNIYPSFNSKIIHLGLPQNLIANARPGSIPGTGAGT